MSDSSSFVNELAEIDWAFRNLSNEGVHSFHWYPATFLSALPGTLIPILSKEGDVVLDPFCGTATTGVEAIRLGRRFIGLDTNPIAILIAHAKLYAPESKNFLRALDLDNLRFDFSTWNAREFSHPQEATLLEWYEKNTYQELAFLLQRIGRIKSTSVRRCAEAVFSSILKKACSQSRHWGWVCDNVKPKAEEIQYRDALEMFEKTVLDYLASTSQLLQDRAHRGYGTRRQTVREASKLICDDCVSVLTGMDDASIDFILTSPPYYGVADYVKSQRLSFLWFDHPDFLIKGYGFSRFDELRERETGSRSFRHRRQSYEQYVNYMGQFFRESQRILRRQGYLALVVGESSARRATLSELIRMAQKASFSLAYQSTREIKQTRRRLMAKVRGEDIIVFRAN